jgi:hypothetical protein
MLVPLGSLSLSDTSDVFDCQVIYQTILTCGLHKTPYEGINICICKIISFDTLMKDSIIFETIEQIQDRLQVSESSGTLWAIVHTSMCCSEILIGLFKAMIYDLIKFCVLVSPRKKH